MFTTSQHQPSPNAKAYADVVAIIGQLAPDLDMSSPQSIVYTLGELAGRYGLTDDHIFELVRQAARRIAANQFTLAVDDVRRIASACERSAATAGAAAVRAAAERAAISKSPVGAIAQALGIEPNIGAIRGRIIDRQLAHRLIDMRLLEALPREPVTAELRRLASAAGLVDGKSALTPSPADWTEALPLLTMQPQLMPRCTRAPRSQRTPAAGRKRSLVACLPRAVGTPRQRCAPVRNERALMAWLACICHAHETTHCNAARST